MAKYEVLIPVSGWLVREVEAENEEEAEYKGGFTTDGEYYRQLKTVPSGWSVRKKED